MIYPLVPQPDGSVTCEVDGQHVRISVADVTPEEAVKVLENRNTRNRKKTQATIDKLAADMREGFFRFNGDAARFDTDDEMLDAQNRYQALVDTGTTAPFLLVENLDPDVMPTIDQDKARTVADILTTGGHAGITNMAIVAATAQLLMAGDRQLRSESTDRKRVALYVEKHLDSLESAAAWAKHVSDQSPRVDIRQYSDRRHCLSPSPLAALHTVMVDRGGDSEMVQNFFEAIADLTPANHFGTSYPTDSNTGQSCRNSFHLTRLTSRTWCAIWFAVSFKRLHGAIAELNLKEDKGNDMGDVKSKFYGHGLQQMGYSARRAV
jgi:hypothetical protein